MSSEAAKFITFDKDVKLDFLKKCYKGDVEAVKSAIEAGADVNWTDGYGYTGLMVAKTPEILDLLISLGADVNLTDRSGHTALMDPDNLIEKIKLLIDAGADVNAACKVGKTALMFTKTPAAVELLLKNGANVNARDNSNTTALMYAVTKGHNTYARYRHSDEERRQTIKLLIDAGAWINYRRKGDKKAALMLVERLTDAIILIESGADVTLQDSTGKLAHQQNRYRGREHEKSESYLKACFDNYLFTQSALTEIKDTPVIDDDNQTIKIRKRL